MIRHHCHDEPRSGRSADLFPAVALPPDSDPLEPA
jgi:hypothetical protein